MPMIGGKYIGAWNESDNVKLRSVRRYTDPHGRKWWCMYDKRAGGPVGSFEPDGWTAPFMPPQQYLVPDDEEHVLHIDYDRMLADNRVAHRSYRQQGVQLCAKLNLPVPKDGAAFPPQVVQEIGEPPISPLPWRAARAGNRFALGLSDAVDSRLARFLPVAAEREAEDVEDWTDKPVSARG